jgi:hypothetical protein
LTGSWRSIELGTFVETGESTDLSKSSNGEGEKNSSEREFHGELRDLLKNFKED